MSNDFTGFPKIPRIDRIFGRVVVTEKVDGTNAHILIEDNQIKRIGSRTRWITPESDNYGFAKWVKENEEDILGLGNGHHFGEWFGNGIQRNYGLKEKRFALFNSRRWNNDNPNRPTCCTCVPEIYSGQFSFDMIIDVASKLLENGSYIVPGFMNPEGFVVYFSEMDQMAKWTYEYKEGKWSTR